MPWRRAAGLPDPDRTRAMKRSCQGCAPIGWRALPAGFVLRVLAMLAYVLMPLGMISTAAATATGNAAPVAISGHCARMMVDGDRTQPVRSSADGTAHCAIACSAIRSIAGALSPPEPAPAVRLPPAVSAAIHGLHPEAALPPPRRTGDLKPFSVTGDSA